MYESICPDYEKAVKKVSSIKADNFLQLKGSTKPTDGVKSVAKVLCIMFENLPKIKPKQDPLTAFWDHFQSHVLTP
jgi:hypothetical protein